MSLNRRIFLLKALAAASASAATGSIMTGCSGPNQTATPAASSADSPLGKAARYLWSQQAEDGGFHSASYGLLRSGQSLTPFVLLALLNLPETEFPRPQGALQRALAFIRANTNEEGALGVMDETAADYPNYATALAVSALVKANGTTKPYDGGLGRGADDEIIGKMVAQLRAQQFSEANGWSPRDAAYGGWGMGGPIHHPPEAGHVDLSMTRHVLEALRASGVASSDPAISRALTYLQRSQNPDGGFYFSPVNPEINKAGEIAYGPDNRGPKKVSGSSAPAVIRRPSNNKPARSSDAGVAADGEPQPPAQDSKHFASYGTTTADGILAWRAAGVLDDDPRITKALDWLKQHHQRDRVPGFADGAGQPWALGLRFYYAHAISRCLPELTVYLPQQSPDGSYRNPVNLVKEDDPLIATTFALYALNSSRA